MDTPVKCKECKELKDWALKQNVCAFCGVANKIVKAEDSCPKGKKR